MQCHNLSLHVIQSGPCNFGAEERSENVRRGIFCAVGPQHPTWGAEVPWRNSAPIFFSRTGPYRRKLGQSLTFNVDRLTGRVDLSQISDPSQSSSHTNNLVVFVAR